MTNEERKYALKIFKLCVNDGIILEGSPLYIACKTAKEALEKKKKTGHWIDETSGYAFNAKCSECGYIVHEQYYTEYKYCPKCGAKMQ